MLINIWKVSEMLGEKVHYCVAGEYDKFSGVHTIVAIDIPERFCPEHNDGTVYLKMNGADGKYSLLENVLDADIFGQPVLKWHDDKLGCTRTATLNYQVGAAGSY